MLDADRVNAGSLERDLLERYAEPCPEAVVVSVLNRVRILEDNDFFEFKISCKASDAFSSGGRLSADRLPSHFREDARCGDVKQKPTSRLLLYLVWL